MFTAGEREQLRAALIAGARADARISAAATTGSAAVGRPSLPPEPGGALGLSPVGAALRRLPLTERIANLMIGESARTGSCGSRDWAVTPPGGQHAVTVRERPSWPDACTANGLTVSPVYPARYAPLTGNYPR